MWPCAVVPAFLRVGSSLLLSVTRVGQIIDFLEMHSVDLRCSSTGTLIIVFLSTIHVAILCKSKNTNKSFRIDYCMHGSLVSVGYVIIPHTN